MGFESDHQNEGKIGCQHDDRKHPGKTATLGDQLLEAGVVIDLLVSIVVIVHCNCLHDHLPPNEDRLATLGPDRLNSTRLWSDFERRKAAS
ncbi:hypothetical protein D3C77_741060 [compost metagenome]